MSGSGAKKAKPAIEITVSSLAKDHRFPVWYTVYADTFTGVETINLPGNIMSPTREHAEKLAIETLQTRDDILWCYVLEHRPLFRYDPPDDVKMTRTKLAFEKSRGRYTP